MGESTVDVISKGVRYLTEQSYLSGFIGFFIHLFLLVLLVFLIYYLIHIGNRFVDQQKKVHINRNQVFNYTIILIVIFLIVFMLQFRQALTSLLSPFFIAISLAYTLNPMVKYLNKKGIGRLWGVLIIYIAFSVVMLILSLTIVPKMTEEIKKPIKPDK